MINRQKKEETKIGEMKEFMQQRFVDMMGQ